MKARGFRDGLLAKHMLNGECNIDAVFLTDTASRFVGSAPGGFTGDYVPATALSRREQSLALILSSPTGENEKTGDIDLQSLPGQLVHDWLAFPRKCGDEVWRFIRGEGFEPLSELAMLGPQLRSLSKGGVGLVRVFCWKTNSIVWLRSESHEKVTATCLRCGAQCGGNVTLMPLPGGEGTLRACCEGHMRELVQFHDANCSTRCPSKEAAAKAQAEFRTANPDTYTVPRDPTAAFCQLSGCERREGAISDDDHSERFQVCSRCKVACYCCKDHQVKDWPSHKPHCIPPSSQ